MGVDVVDIIGLHTGIIKGSLHGQGATSVVGLGYASAIAREAIAHYFAQDIGASCYGMVIVLENKCRGTSRGYQSVAVAVKGSAGSRRVFHAQREGSDGIKR